MTRKPVTVTLTQSQAASLLIAYGSWDGHIVPGAFNANAHLLTQGADVGIAAREASIILLENLKGN